jgi:anti-sigma B factor antagonist
MSETNENGEIEFEVQGFNGHIDEDLQVSLRRMPCISNCLVVHLKGYVDTQNAFRFDLQIARLIEKGFINLVFDCGEMGMTSSVIIGSFAGFLKRVRPIGGNIALLNLSNIAKEVLGLLGFAYFFYVANNLEDALQFFKQNN